MWLPPALSSLVKHGNGLLASQSCAFRFCSPSRCRSKIQIVSFHSTCLFIILVAKLCFLIIRGTWCSRHCLRSTTAMKANKPHPRDSYWAHQRQNLRRDGTMLRFKLGAPAPHLLGIMRNEPAVSLQSSFVAEHAVIFPNFEEAPRSCSNEDDEQDTRPWIRNKTLQTLAKTCLGGLRGDPFDTFPIPNQGHVPSAFDYCRSNPPFPTKH